MIAGEKRQRIYELIDEEGSARVSTLSKIFSVTEPTIRGNLEKLEAEGVVVRDHGGAYLRDVDRLVRTGALHRTRTSGRPSDVPPRRR